ncbi:MAG: hypothetical protein KDA60_05305, partial [Planctomycetales bacterium]|nr:hypothetical protein [Planctomycetales bacterium]
MITFLNTISDLLLSQLWQTALVTLLVALLSATLLRKRPQLAYLFWMLAIVKFLTPPIYSSTIAPLSRLPAAVSILSTPWSSTPSSSIPSSQSEASAITAIDPDLFYSDLPTAPFTPGANNEPQVFRALPARTAQPQFSTAVTIGLACMITWAVIAAALAVHFWRRWLRLAHLAASTSVPIRSEWQSTFQAALDHSRLPNRYRSGRRAVRLVVTHQSVGPFVIGWYRPTVVIPEAVCRNLVSSRLTPIMVHELLHVRRGDTWASLLQIVAQVVWWFHPLVWWSSRLATRTREEACDEQAVARTRVTPAEYARGLTDVLAEKLTTHAAVLTPGMLNDGAVQRRVQSLLHKQTPFRATSPWWYGPLWASALLLFLPGAPLATSQVRPEPAPTENTPVASNSNATDQSSDRESKEGESALVTGVFFASSELPTTDATRSQPLDVLGFVTDSIGRPVMNGHVLLVATDRTVLGRTTTDENGKFLFSAAEVPVAKWGESPESHGAISVYVTHPEFGLSWSPMHTVRFNAQGKLTQFTNTGENTWVAFEAFGARDRVDVPAVIDVQMANRTSVGGRIQSPSRTIAG